MKLIIFSLFLSTFAFALDVPLQIRFQFAAQDAEYLAKKGEYIFASPQVSFNESPFEIAEIHTRGDHCSHSPRRCFVLKPMAPIQFGSMSGKSFVLSSMYEDRGYVSSHTGLDFMKSQRLFLPNFNFTELQINDESRGLYIAMEHPHKYLSKVMGAPYVGRRGMNGRISTKDFSVTKTEHTQAEFVSAFREIYTKSLELQGEALYVFLKERMNIDNYLKWLAINSLLMNGDYTDEIFFYARPAPLKTDRIYFEVSAWDTEDLFKGPHSGPINAQYKEVIQKSLVYSMEDPLDRVLVNDPYMLAKYWATLKELLLMHFTPEDIHMRLNNTRTAMAPFLEIERIIVAAKIDGKIITKNFVFDLIEKRKVSVLQRRELLLRALNQN